MDIVPNTVLPAALYARYSTDMQRDTSIEDQLRVCERLARQSGFAATVAYSDRGISGAAIARRPGIQALLSAARAGQIGVVIAEGMDRLSRGLAEMPAIYERMTFLEIPIVTVAEGRLTEMHVAFGGAKNAMQIKDTGRMVRRAQEGRVLAGRSAGGIAYGYRVVYGPEKGLWEKEPAECLVVARILAEYAQGRSARAIAKMLNGEGIPAPGGGPWSPSSILGNRQRGTGILNNEVYVGRRVWNRQRFVKDPETGRRIGRVNGEAARVAEAAPELRVVTDDLWAAVKARQDLAPTGGPRAGAVLGRARRPKSLLSGLVRCGACGGACVMRGHHRYGCAAAYDKGTCGNRARIRIDVVERTVMAGIREHLLNAEMFALFAEGFVARMNQRAMRANVERQTAQDDLEKVDRQLNRLVDEILAGTPGRVLRGRMEELEEKRARLEAILAGTPEAVPYQHPNLPALFAQRRDALDEALSAGSPLGIETIRSLIERVDLTPDGQTGTLRIDLHGHIAGMMNFCGAQQKPADPYDAFNRVIALVAEERSQCNYPLAFYGLPLVA